MTVAGIVCGNCDRLNPVESAACGECGSSLALESGADPKERARAEKESSVAAPPEDAVPGAPPSAAQQGAGEEPMDQARHYICKSCYSQVPGGHKFCGKCGTATEGDAALKDPNFFGDMQTPGKAKLILIKGEGMDGISYHLNSTEHVAGRQDGPILFTEDKWLSPKHANFVYVDGALRVRDERSVNGVFLALRGPTEIWPGAVFMAGEQVFRIESVAPYSDDAEPDGTFFFSSPRTDSAFRLVQVLEGGGDGMVVCARENLIMIGREGCDMNFPNDPYISGNHVKIELVAGRLMLVDLGSKNGTYMKVTGEHELVHGDYIFLGRQLLRVEITS
jgi:pSer/pThr/pTyr-binding forkhead associated (FHA) protein/ribosomal protein L40E